MYIYIYICIYIYRERERDIEIVTSCSHYSILEYSGRAVPAMGYAENCRSAICVGWAEDRNTRVCVCVCIDVYIYIYIYIYIYMYVYIHIYIYICHSVPMPMPIEGLLGHTWGWTTCSNRFDVQGLWFDRQLLGQCGVELDIRT